MDRPFGWDLPPGVTESMIPGNRKEDIDWENAAEKVDSPEIEEACWNSRVDCDFAQWCECHVCDGTGTQDGYDCNGCGGSKKKFLECEMNIVDTQGKHDGNNDADCCPQWESLVEYHLKRD